LTPAKKKNTSIKNNKPDLLQKEQTKYITAIDNISGIVTTCWRQTSVTYP